MPCSVVGGSNSVSDQPNCTLATFVPEVRYITTTVVADPCTIDEAGYPPVPHYWIASPDAVGVLVTMVPPPAPLVFVPKTLN